MPTNIILACPGRDYRELITPDNSILSSLDEVFGKRDQQLEFMLASSPTQNIGVVGGYFVAVRGDGRVQLSLRHRSTGDPAKARTKLALEYPGVSDPIARIATRGKKLWIYQSEEIFINTGIVNGRISESSLPIYVGRLVNAYLELNSALKPQVGNPACAGRHVCD